MPWQDLKRLQECCDVKLESFVDADDKLCWKMEVRRRGSNPPPPLHAKGHDITDAVQRGVKEAFEAGWLEARQFTPLG